MKVPGTIDRGSSTWKPLTIYQESLRLRIETRAVVSSGSVSRLEFGNVSIVGVTIPDEGLVVGIGDPCIMPDNRRLRYGLMIFSPAGISESVSCKTGDTRSPRFLIISNTSE